MNKEVDSILGNELEAQVLGEKFMAAPKDMSFIRKELGLKKSAAPSFQSDVEAALNALNALQQQPYVLQTVSGSYVCVFELGGVLSITSPKETDAMAACCALFFILKNKSVVT